MKETNQSIAEILLAYSTTTLKLDLVGQLVQQAPAARWRGASAALRSASYWKGKPADEPASSAGPSFVS